MIRDWFVNIFQPVEKTADLVVTDFKFEQMMTSSSSSSANNRSNSAKNGRGPPLGNSVVQNPRRINSTAAADATTDTCTTADEGEEDDDILDAPPFRVLKKADVDMKVGGKAKKYSVVIKVLPTDDPERHTSRRKFRQLLKFSKEVQARPIFNFNP